MGSFSSRPTEPAASSQAARPVVLVGQLEAVGKRVAKHLLPEFEVILEVLSTTRARAELLKLKAGETPCTDGDNVGTHNFSQTPKHVIFSKGYTMKRVQDIREACGGSESGICWYWTPSLPGEKLPNPAKIDEAMLDLLAEKIAIHIKTVMNEVVNAGSEGEDGVYEL